LEKIFDATLVGAILLSMDIINEPTSSYAPYGATATVLNGDGSWWQSDRLLGKYPQVEPL